MCPALSALPPAKIPTLVDLCVPKVVEFFTESEQAIAHNFNVPEDVEEKLKHYMLNKHEEFFLKELSHTISHENRPLKDIIISPFGNYCATVSDWLIKIWHTKNWQEKQTFHTTFTAAQDQCAFSPDEKQYVVGQLNKLEIFDTNSDKLVRSLPNINRNERLERFIYTPDGKYIITASIESDHAGFSSDLTTWSTSDYTKPLAHKDALLSDNCMINSTGEYLATFARKEISLYQVPSLEKIRNILFTDTIKTIAWNPANNTLALLFSDGFGKQVAIENPLSREINTHLHCMSLNSDDSLSFTPDGSQLIVSGNKEISFLDAPTLVLKKKFTNLSSGQISNARMTNNGRFFSFLDTTSITNEYVSDQKLATAHIFDKESISCKTLLFMLLFEKFGNKGKFILSLDKSSWAEEGRNQLPPEQQLFTAKLMIAALYNLRNNC